MPPLIISQKKFELEVSKRAALVCDHIAAEMGAEIHDDLIQRLSVVQFYLDQLDRSVDDKMELERLLFGLRTDFEQIKVAVRNISQRLMPIHSDDETLSKSIELLCKANPARIGNIHFALTGQEFAIDRTCRSYLYRISQELIHNAFKHSTAWNIWLRMRWGLNSLLIEIEDDGTDFKKTSETIGRLRGKQNTLRLRSKAIGARLSFHHGKKGLMVKIQYAKPSKDD